MKLLKKTLKDFKNNFYIIVFIDLIFFLSSFFTFYFASKIIQNNVLLIYSLAEKLEEFNQLLTDSVEASALMGINSQLELINNASNYIIGAVIISAVIFFMLWCFFKGLIWKYSYDYKKHIFKGFWSYIKKFAVISLLLFFVLVPLFIFMLGVMGSFVLSAGMYDFNLSGFLIFLLMFYFVFLLVLYLFSVVAVMLNKHKIWESLKKGFLNGVKRPLMFLSFVGLWILVFVVLYVDRIISVFWKGFMVVDLLVILLLFALYRFWFCERFK